MASRAKCSAAWCWRLPNQPAASVVAGASLGVRCCAWPGLRLVFYLFYFCWSIPCSPGGLTGAGSRSAVTHRVEDWLPSLVFGCMARGGRGGVSRRPRPQREPAQALSFSKPSQISSNPTHLPPAPRPALPCPALPRPARVIVSRVDLNEHE